VQSPGFDINDDEADRLKPKTFAEVRDILQVGNFSILVGIV